MCGIVGAFGAFSGAEAESLVQAMNATIEHRGPDDSGHWVADGIAIGMTRLSIIDLAGGHQPMWTDDGLGIVYNGEIYNYRALRQELEAVGYSFRTDSDTEVLLYTLHRHGLAGVSRLEGMFGVCLLDTRNGKAHLIRDRLGIKPLYFATNDQGFYFASEIKAIQAAVPHGLEVDEQAVYDYLTLQYVPAPRTIWQDVHKLQPGHCLTLDLASREWQVERYWQARFEAEPLDPRRDYQTEFRELFLGAVESHLVAADVPVGLLLSGGLDSSAVGAAAIELGHRAFHTFTVAVDRGGEMPDLELARRVSEHIGSRHHEIVIGQQDYVDAFDSMVWHHDEPLAAISSIPMHFVSKLAREEVKVVLAGEGADEVLGGYHMDQTAREAALRKRRYGWVPRQLFALLAGLASGPRAETLRQMGRRGWSGYLAGRSEHMSFYFDEAEKRRLLRKSGDWRDTESLIRGWYEPCASDEPLDQLQQVFCHSWLPENLLVRADKMSMSASLELRVPFLDHKLVEWAGRLPHHWKVGDAQSGYTTKRVLREFVASRLPREVIEAPKRGYVAFPAEWFRPRQPLGEMVRDCLLDASGPLADWLDTAFVSGLIDRAAGGDGEAANGLWLLLGLERWMRRSL